MNNLTEKKLKTKKTTESQFNNCEIHIDDLPKYVQDFIGTYDFPTNRPVTSSEVWGDGPYNRETKKDRGLRVAVYKEECPITRETVPYHHMVAVVPSVIFEEVEDAVIHVYGFDPIYFSYKVLGYEKEELYIVGYRYTCDDDIF